MTAKEFVLSKKPTAMQEKQTTNGGVKYYLVRERGSSVYIGEGDTSSKAWIDAKHNILESEKRNIISK